LDAEVCKKTIIHKEKVNRIKRKVGGQDFSRSLALGKYFGIPSKIKIFYALETFKKMCVCDLAAI